MHGEKPVPLTRQKFGIWPTRDFWLREAATGRARVWLGLTGAACGVLGLWLATALRSAGVGSLWLRIVIAGAAGALIFIASKGLYERRKRRRSD